MDTISVWHRFEKIVEGILLAEGFRVTAAPRRGQQPSADYLIKAGDLSAAVEAKLYSSRFVSITSLLQSAFILNEARKALNVKSSILFVGNILPETSRNIVKEKFPETIIYDLAQLASLIKKHPQYFEEFESVIREARPFSNHPGTIPSDDIGNINIEEDLRSLPIVVTGSDALGPPIDVPNIQKGRDLCNEFRLIPPGRDHARLFEEKGTEILKYIFEKDLTAWSPQQATDTNLSFFDLVARVYSDHDFWNAIATQFRSRYVIFEFKNYTDEIKQGQIYTTEKYLYAAALRTTAVLITRVGADSNAQAAIRGALREHGKLMLVLTLDDICQMLELRDRGDDHNKILTERLDNMLMKLER